MKKMTLILLRALESSCFDICFCILFVYAMCLLVADSTHMVNKDEYISDIVALL